MVADLNKVTKRYGAVTAVDGVTPPPSQGPAGWGF